MSPQGDTSSEEYLAAEGLKFVISLDPPRG
jgi:hypothetical protein